MSVIWELIHELSLGEKRFCFFFFLNWNLRHSVQTFLITLKILEFVSPKHFFVITNLFILLSSEFKTNPRASFIWVWHSVFERFWIPIFSMNLSLFQFYIFFTFILYFAGITLLKILYCSANNNKIIGKCPKYFIWASKAQIWHKSGLHILITKYIFLKL